MIREVGIINNERYNRVRGTSGKIICEPKIMNNIPIRIEPRLIQNARIVLLAIAWLGSVFFRLTKYTVAGPTPRFKKVTNNSGSSTANV